MNKLETSYLGLKLKNPIIIGSSGLTDTPEKNLKLEKAGAAAVVLKSLFEEQILIHNTNNTEHSSYTEALDYVKNYVHSHNLSDYLELIKETKKICTIPVIASINCYKTGDWDTFAHQIELAGADAIELNIFLINTDKNTESSTIEQAYIDIVKQTRKAVKIPIIVKLGKQFSNLARITEQLMAAGANSLVLFNRYYQPDINLKTIEVIQGNTFTSSADFANTLRWTSLISTHVKNANIVSTTGVHDWQNATKAILVGAQAVQICSTIYQHGNGVIQEILTNMEDWMNEHGFSNLDEFRGSLIYGNAENATLFERAQFMKYYSDAGHTGEIYFS